MNWVYNILITAIVSSIFTMFVERVILYTAPKTTDEVCSKFYWEFKNFMDSQKEVGI